MECRKTLSALTVCICCQTGKYSTCIGLWVTYANMEDQKRGLID